MITSGRISSVPRANENSACSIEITPPSRNWKRTRPFAHRDTGIEHAHAHLLAGRGRHRDHVVEKISPRTSSITGMVALAKRR